MDDKKRLPDAELAVMQAIWAVGGEVSRGDLDGALASHGWSANTVNTYLTRLCEKGFLSSRREGRNNLYTPLVSKDRYLEFESRSVLKRLYGGSLRRGAERRAAARTERDRRAAAVFGRYEPVNGDKKEDAPWKHFC